MRFFSLPFHSLDSTREGEIVKTHVELKLEGNGEQIILWPDVVCHVIDETSPLFQFKLNI